MRKRSKKSVTLFDLARLREELERANREIEQPDFWNNLEYAQKVMKEKKTMEATIENYESLEKSLSDIGEMIELTEMEEASGASAEELAEMAAGIEADYADFEKKLEDLIRQMLGGA